ncbi:hypothetical protein [Burkholderia multivorans]|uniref:hypothetical protein n=1 Tax=Burkholderia multivorans TaxID=87883 RepID=UPI0011B22855|nr:hypothetical protein [Burkholderia multivorans]MBY4791619.1 hypothetical protein [Burkholderia multivorans]
MKKIAAFLVVGMVALTGCSKKPDGSEFVGIWYDPVKGEKLQITPNGQSFLIKELPSDRNPKPMDATVPATYQDGLLKAVVGNNTSTISHVQSDDTIILPLMNGQGTETLGRVKE